MSEGSIQYASHEGVATITIDRPEKRNAFSNRLCHALGDAWSRFQESPADRVAILVGAGPVFTAGADLRDPPKDLWRAMPGLGQKLDKPVIAAVEGKVIGMGVALIGFCDLCVASSEASFMYPEARLGLAAGLATAIAARMPHKVALEVLLLGQPLTAERAHEVGFVNRVVAAGHALPVAREMAAVLASGAPLVHRFLKDLVAQTINRSPLEAMYPLQQAVAVVAQSADAQEGVRAFREGRPPRFTGS